MATPQQLRLFQLENYLSNMKASAVGAAGEQVALLLLEQSGYEVVVTNRRGHSGDLKAIDRATGEMWRIDVKTSRRRRSHYVFCLRKQGYTDIGDVDYVLLLPTLRSGRVVPFLVPVSEFGAAQSFTMRGRPEEYAGRLARYRQGKHIRLGEEVSADVQRD